MQMQKDRSGIRALLGLNCELGGCQWYRGVILL
jgi:hypothetical protein